MWWCSVRTAGQMAEDVLSCELMCFCTLVLRVDLVYHFIYFCKWDRFIISLFFYNFIKRNIYWIYLDLRMPEALYRHHFGTNF